jgi:hypothetical protein
MTARKDFAQTAFDVMRQATGETPKVPAPAPKPAKKTAPRVTKGAVKKAKKKAV